RRVTVVIGDEVDLSPVDAALSVDLAEIGGFGLADHAVGGRGPAIGHDIAELDLGVGRADIILLLVSSIDACRRKYRKGSRKKPQSQRNGRHRDLPGPG